MPSNSFQASATNNITITNTSNNNNNNNNNNHLTENYNRVGQHKAESKDLKEVVEELLNKKMSPKSKDTYKSHVSLIVYIPLNILSGACAELRAQLLS